MNFLSSYTITVNMDPNNTAYYYVHFSCLNHICIYVLQLRSINCHAEVLKRVIFLSFPC